MNPTYKIHQYLIPKGSAVSITDGEYEFEGVLLDHMVVDFSTRVCTVLGILKEQDAAISFSLEGSSRSYQVKARDVIEFYQ